MRSVSKKEKKINDEKETMTQVVMEKKISINLGDNVHHREKCSKNL